MRPTEEQGAAARSRTDRDPQGMPPSLRSLAREEEARLRRRIARAGPSAGAAPVPLGILLALRGRWSQAAEAFERAVRGDPEGARARLLLLHARVEGLGEEPSLVLDGWDPTASVTPLPDRYRRYAVAWAALRRRDGAHLAELLEAPAAGPRGHLFRAMLRYACASARGDRASAEREAHRLHAAHPLLDPAHLARLAAGPFWNPLHAAGYARIARVALKAGFADRARAAWEEAFRLDPDASRLASRMVRLAPFDGDEEAALRRIASGLSGAPRSVRLRVALGLEYLREGFVREATREIAGAVGSPRALRELLRLGRRRPPRRRDGRESGPGGNGDDGRASDPGLATRVQHAGIWTRRFVRGGPAPSEG
ncbi:MAG: tetratricopeptide repeat protein [Candidatus Eisenbacteria bacterium]